MINFHSTLKPVLIYVYLVPKGDWPKKVHTQRLDAVTHRDICAKTRKVLGYEFLSAYGVEIDTEAFI